MAGLLTGSTRVPHWKHGTRTMNRTDCCDLTAPKDGTKLVQPLSMQAVPQGMRLTPLSAPDLRKAETKGVIHGSDSREVEELRGPSMGRILP